MEIVTLLDKLESLIETSARFPGTRRTIVDTDKVMELLDQIRLTVPQDIKAAQDVLSKKDILVNQAQVEARKIKSTADEEYRARLDTNDITKASQRRAQEIIEDAQRRAQRTLDQSNAQARNIVLESELYSAEVLKKLDKQLTAVLGTVRRGLETLDHEATVEEEPEEAPVRSNGRVPARV